MNTYNCLINGENQEITLTEAEHHKALMKSMTLADVVESRKPKWKCSDPRSKCGALNSEDEVQCSECGEFDSSTTPIN